MFKQVFRITFVTLIWKQYKRLIVSTLVLFAYLWLVGSIHEDYLNYAELQSDANLAGKSFIYKWAALMAGVLIYISFHLFRGKKAGQRNKTRSTKLNAKPNTSPTDPEQNEGPDPFAEIRLKKKLRSRSEIMINKQKN